MLDRIRDCLPTLPNAEQRVGKLVLDNPARFARLPIGELASLAGVSKPTVLRFCRSLGYEGLTHFKLQLASSLGAGVPYVHQSVDESDDALEVAHKVIDNAAAALLQFRRALPKTGLHCAADALEQAWRGRHRIEIYGVGNSGMVAQDAQHKLFRLGVNCRAFTDGHLQIMSAALMAPGDVAIVFSNSGRTRDLVDATDVARGQGATTIVITRTRSPLAQSASVLLPADHTERYDQDIPMISRLLHLLYVDALAINLALRMGATQVQPLLKTVKDHLHRKRYT
jgi:RpiR family carbohydrate utilization transcriptional regulator